MSVGEGPAVPAYAEGMGSPTDARMPSVVSAAPAFDAEADAFARRVGLTRLALQDWRTGLGGAVVVWCDGDGPALRGPVAGRTGPVRPTPPAPARPGRDPLLRAVGPWPRVIDATAGWGVDAGTLAAAGRDVVLVERDPVLAALLASAVGRWRGAGVEAAARMRVVCDDARRFLAGAETDVVLIDPMYPDPAGGRGRARARKAESVHLLRRLVGDDGDQHELLAVARRAARRRVVVKRPRQAAPLAGRDPSGVLAGRTVRYDLYAPEEVPT